MTRSEHIEARLGVLEFEYRARLVEALRDCAAGRWGLFGHNEHLAGAPRAPSVVDDLTEAGEEIGLLRRRLGLEPFALHERLCALRGPADPNAPGEPKQARAWLVELGEL